ncbi:hypothetical protein M9458_051135 [Cirrhinus mrigala]|uniref:Integrase catalytic domain-containing protein n=1 Tax=Cirrhinus mrigala TaxID=683832 RepID=A0ABD0MX07_CIRMR
MPRLELSAALTGAQIAKVLQRELTVTIRQVILWTDSTTVLHWLLSDSCRYKVFVGTRVAEIQSLTDISSWRYVDSGNNPADDITHGKSLKELAQSCRWANGPHFLYQSEASWPNMPAADPEPDTELKKSALCLHLCTSLDVQLPDADQYQTWRDLRAQRDSFPEEVKALSSNQPLPPNSRLVSLSPEYDEDTGLIRVGGRLRHAEHIDLNALHPIVLDPHQQLTKLLIKEYDANLLHPGPERVLAELRRHYWILRGRAAIKKCQLACTDCQRWRAQPKIPMMANLPPARLRLYKPPFFSTGMDCFGPFTVKIGRRTEKRWGIVFKCMTTRCLHLDLLESLDSDAFLMSLRRFIARRGKPFELFSDNGTNFVGGNREIKEAYKAMAPRLKEQLAEQKISFRFIPPSAPHFGGIWEREVKSVKQALKVILKEQIVPETVLHTVLTEVEGIMNAKPLGYVSSDIADSDPITPSILLMGHHDSSLPQVIYDSSNLLATRRWRHSQILADQFWARFIKYYLPSLQERQKWQRDNINLRVDQVVFIMDPQHPRALLPVGKITCTFPGPDGRIRTAAVQVQDRTYVRPEVRLIPLPRLENSDNPNPAT